ncbi:MAG: iron-containing alcohol dehydrogenase [Ardenticatenaceae bacterium]|nr:iron-containing alcohol dehydrogenase [Ardenticatenaceae bacterium]
MWYFSSPEIVFGDEALSRLEHLSGTSAFIVTDANMVRLGFVDRVQARLALAGMESAVFAEVEPDPSLQTVRRCAAAMAEYQPEWVIGLGGGSSMDAAKAAWFLYERPDVDLGAINPFEAFGLRAKARLITIPTTSGTGADVTQGVVLTDHDMQCKIVLATRELQADIAIVDPSLVMELPAQITADTGIDVLTHAVEAYTCTWHNDFTDGLCLKAIELVFTYLPRAYADGTDAEAREHMHNAATIAGLAITNAMVALAHSLAHSLGGVFHTPHGRTVGAFLPYTIEFTANAGSSRYGEIARFLHLPANDELEGAASFVTAFRELQARIRQPHSIRELGIEVDAFEEALPHLIANAEGDTQMVTSLRVPDRKELERLFRYAYEGRTVDF